MAARSVGCGMPPSTNISPQLELVSLQTALEYEQRQSLKAVPTELWQVFRESVKCPFGGLGETLSSLSSGIWRSTVGALSRLL